MTRVSSSEAGVTVVELLVATSVLAIISVSFMSVLLSVSRSADTNEEIVRVSEEARSGMNRIVREAREGQLIGSLSATRFEIRNDYDGDGVYETPRNENGDYEFLAVEYDPVSRVIYLNGEVLVANVEPIDATTPLFSFTSNDLRFDWNGDGVTSKEELDAAPAKGFTDVDGSDVSLYDNVRIRFRILVGGETRTFDGQAQLRNRR
jgi:type II secretory pathway pseudopilin PulG